MWLVARIGFRLHPASETAARRQLGVFNAGYLTGGVLVIVSLVLLLGVISRHSDAVFERKLAGKITLREGET